LLRKIGIAQFASSLHPNSSNSNNNNHNHNNNNNDNNNNNNNNNNDNNNNLTQHLVYFMQVNAPNGARSSAVG
jgi:hypothetical protein